MDDLSRSRNAADSRCAHVGKPAQTRPAAAICKKGRTKKQKNNNLRTCASARVYRNARNTLYLRTHPVAQFHPARVT